ncbi:hypothetical protein CGCF413_v015595 [Colletotrichum fructicola]|nr:hypothetical protein CGCF413_v015595 [Colletotrichum fructicola]
MPERYFIQVLVAGPNEHPTVPAQKWTAAARFRLEGDCANLSHQPSLTRHPETHFASVMTNPASDAFPFARPRLTRSKPIPPHADPPIGSSRAPLIQLGVPAPCVERSTATPMSSTLSSVHQRPLLKAPPGRPSILPVPGRAMGARTNGKRLSMDLQQAAARGCSFVSYGHTSSFVSRDGWKCGDGGASFAQPRTVLKADTTFWVMQSRSLPCLPTLKVTKVAIIFMYAGTAQNRKGQKLD